MAVEEAGPSSDAPTPLLARLRQHAARQPDAIAYREIGPDGAIGRSLTFGELQQRVDRLAGYLASRLQSGAVVILCCPNVIEYPVAFLGILSAGCTALAISSESTESELLRAGMSANAMALVAADDVTARVGSRFGLVIPTSNLPQHDQPQPPVCGDRAGLLLLSSGTTDRPKLVHRSLPSLDAVSDQMVRAIGFGPDDRVLSMVPLCHSYGIEHGLLAPMAAGAGVHLCPGFNLPVILDQLRRGGITIFPSVPSVFEMLSQLAEPGTRLPSLRVAYSAGGALPRAVYDACIDKLRLRVGQLYGATEVGSITFNDPRIEPFDPASVGAPMRGVEIRISSLSDPAVPVPTGAEGQVCIRAASMFSGYVGEAGTPLIDGYFPTADLGRVDALGRLTISGRLKLLIDVGGLKVNPIEVESVLLEHPGVSGCVVLPVRQSQTLYRLKAVVTPRHADQPPEVEALRQFARERLAPYKVPRIIELREALPRTATGKVLRHLVEA